jgi:energy-coupling factor transporter transmembrane protein EcfT
MVFIQLENQRKIHSMKPQFKISSLIVTLFAVALLVASFDEVFNPNPWTENEDYLFPRFLACGIALLSILLYFEKDISKKTSFKQLLPGLILIVIYVFVVKTVGFYVTSLIMFFSVVMIYHKREESTDFWRVCVVKLGVSVVFTVVLYLLFTELLNVYPPKGLFL